MTEKFKPGDIVTFDVYGTDLKGSGEVLGKAMGGICPMWMILIQDRDTRYMKSLKEKGLLVQENFMRAAVPTQENKGVSK